MKNSTLLITVSFLFVSLAACGGGAGESSDSGLFRFLTAHQDGHGGFHGRHLRDGHGASDDGFLAYGRRGGQHRRGDMDRPGPGNWERRGGGMGPGFGQGRGMRDGQGRGMRDGHGRGMHDGQGRGIRDGHGRGMREGGGRGMREGGGRHMGPPAEALSACEGKKAGDACSFELEGETVQSTCSARRSGEGPLACRAGRGTHQRHDTPAK